jgi:hypothetical protein
MGPFSAIIKAYFLGGETVSFIGDLTWGSGLSRLCLTHDGKTGMIDDK